MSNETPWRVGRKLGRTVYCGEKFVAFFDTPAMAQIIVDRMNADWNRTGYTTMNDTLSFVMGENKTFLTISGEGQITLGPAVTWDEAAECLLAALEKATGRPIERAAPPNGADPKGEP